MKNKYVMRLSVLDLRGRERRFTLGDPVSAGRTVRLRPRTVSTNAFGLPLLVEKPLEFGEDASREVGVEGTCNVDSLCYVPHGLTHLETAAHILPRDAPCSRVSDLPAGQLSGITYLIDLVDNSENLIPWEPIEKRLDMNTLPISMLALKTRASTLPEHFDFSNQNFLALSPHAAECIHDWPEKIECLLLDLPSADPETDQGRMLAHRHFFGLRSEGDDRLDDERRVIVELAYFKDLAEGYYLTTITPSRFETQAVATGLTLQPLIESL